MMYVPATSASIASSRRSAISIPTSEPRSPAARIAARASSGMVIPGTSLWRNSAWRVETSGSTPSRTGTGKPRRTEPSPGLGEHRLDLLDRVERLGHHQVRARPSSFRSRRSHSVAASAAVESRAQAIVNPARWPIDAPDGSSAQVEPGQDLDQADRIDVPDAGPGRVVADPRRVAGQGDDVADAEGVGAEQLRLERHQVPVTRRAMDQALEVEVVLDPEGHRQGAHPDPGHRRVGDVDEVDAGVAQEPGRLDRPLDPDAPRRVDLDRDDEATGGEQLGEARRRRRVVGGRGRRRSHDRPGSTPARPA